MTAARLALWLFVVILGIAFGAGLYEHRIALPRWITRAGGVLHWDAASARRDDTGLRFWAYVSTGPLTILTLANLFFAWSASAPARAWWLAAASLVVAERALTFSYFIPTMVGLMNAADSPAAAATAVRWARFNYIRHLLVLGGWLAALKTLTLAG
jgi:hypothetical protein